MAITFWEELSKVQNQRRKIYFQWKNGIENLKVNYGEWTEDEFVAHCEKSWLGGKITNREYFLNNMKRWESSAEYKRLLALWHEDNFIFDLLEIYDKVKEKALNETDSQAIKNTIMLQEEIKKYRKSIDEFQELEEQAENEDDGLII